MSDQISRQAAIDEMQEYWRSLNLRRKRIPLAAEAVYMDLRGVVATLPFAHPPEIIRCNACRHWHQTTGKMKGFGLGDCDYLEKKLVTCNGYCYWAERRTNG